jgi:hypothetical protein
MLSKTKTALAALLFFGSASADGTRREPDPHQRRTGNFRQI